MAEDLEDILEEHERDMYEPWQGPARPIVTPRLVAPPSKISPQKVEAAKQAISKGRAILEQQRKKSA